MDAQQLREAFTGYYAARGHAVVPSASLIPHDPTVLFTIAGMVPFKPYFLGDERSAFKRATSVQKCFRTLDIEVVGTTERHCTFFEMLGNFSFGDYFKSLAIPFAWELLTEVLGIEADRLWVTVHESDDEAEAIWLDEVGVDPGRVQRMGEDNFWKMGDTGPCGPCSELYFDRGAALGIDGGPANDDGDRYVEIYNLVFMQYNRLADGSLVDLPSRNIDTGAGLERILPIVQGVGSMFDSDVFRPVIATGEEATGVRYGAGDHAADVSLRILADHGRAMAMLVADGVNPSNDGRGYVLRRVIRRAVRHAHRLSSSAAHRRPGTRRGTGSDLVAVTPLLVRTVAETLGAAHPSLVEQLDLVCATVEREEGHFRRTLETGQEILEEALGTLARTASAGSGADGVHSADGVDSADRIDSGHRVDSAGGVRPQLPGEVVFRLHDTHGFPVELTTEIAAENGVEVDRPAFDVLMQGQRSNARADARAKRATAGDEATYRGLLDNSGPNEFTGYRAYEQPAVVLAVLAAGANPAETAGATKGGAANGSTAAVEIFLDRTPFYAEAGGQIGDTGVITTETGKAVVHDTQSVLPGLIAHRATVTGEIFPGQEALAVIDAPRREAIRRNHTGTHLLHAALRAVLGTHVRQQGSNVGPDRLRFDFSHHQGVRREELEAVTAMANEDVLTDCAVKVTETSKKQAESMGAIAFFGDKYGERVRVVEAGPHSKEFCGGTHVDALGMIGPVAVLSESSIGSNTRRIEALTGEAAVGFTARRQRLVDEAVKLLRVEPDGLIAALERLVERQRQSDKELQRLRARSLEADAAELAGTAAGGAVIARRDGLGADELRELAAATRRRLGSGGVVLAGSPDGAKVALGVATGGEPDAGTLAKQLAAIVGGGGGGSSDLASAGGREPARIGELLDEAASRLRTA